ncbi:MAG: hypothetical protein WC647_10145 [Desulfomonilaceae bacterium]
MNEAPAQQGCHLESLLDVSFSHALKYCLDVVATVAEFDKRSNSRIRECPQGEARNDQVKLLGSLHIRNEAERYASDCWSACHYEALLSKLFGLVQCRENNVFDEGANGVFGKRLACLDMVKLD